MGASDFFQKGFLLSKVIGALHLERRESKPKARLRVNKGIEMNPKADDSHPSTNEA
jgi:hypothetical protein